LSVEVAMMGGMTVIDTGTAAAATTTDLAVGRVSTPVGTLHLVVSGVGLMALSWSGVRPAVTRLGLPVVFDPDRVRPVADHISAYVDGDRDALHRITVDWRLTSGVTRTVLQTLHREVPFGSTITYGELAAASGTDVPARAVGGIMGANPIPVVVPCHRVLAHDGLGGYSGGTGDGLETKRQLLAHEGVLPATLY
jgi:methylated-DNA-[protein]-cysteine S-methyltransferase